MTVRSLLALALAPLLLSGCFLVDGGARSSTNSRSADYPESGTLERAKGPQDTYVSFTGTKKSDGSFGFMSFARDLWTPFRWEVTVGALDPDRHPGQARICTELDVKGSSPLQFYLLCAQPQSNGSMLVYAGTHNGNLDFLVFPSTEEVDLAIEADGDTLRFLARPRNSGGYQEVDSIPFSDGPSPLRPSFGASSLGIGAEAGFDEFRVVYNGTPPGPEAAEHDELRESIWRIADDAFAALYDMDGAFTDPADARDSLQDAVAAAESLLAEGDFSGSRAVKKAGKGLKKGIKKMNGAIKKIDQEKPASKVVKDIAKALKAMLAPLPGIDE